MKEPTLVIMAAGMGSRFGGLKQITPIDYDEIILDYSLYDAYLAGFKKAVLVIKEENQDDFSKILSKASKFIDIKYAYQKLTDLPEGYTVPEGRTKPWGTCHAMYSARNLVDGPFAVINADDFYGRDAIKKIYDYLTEKNSYAMVGYQIENTLTENGTVARGVCKSRCSNLTSINERLKIGYVGKKIIDENTKEEYKAGTPVSLNLWGFPLEFMDKAIKALPIFMEEALGNKESREYAISDPTPLKSEYALPNLVSQVMKKDNVKVKLLKTDSKWYGVTYREDLETVQNAIKNMKKEGIYPEHLWG